MLQAMLSNQIMQTLQVDVSFPLVAIVYCRIARAFILIREINHIEGWCIYHWERPMSSGGGLFAKMKVTIVWRYNIQESSVGSHVIRSHVKE